MWNKEKLRKYIDEGAWLNKQCAFWDEDYPYSGVDDEPVYIGGIIIGANTILCGCCGGTINIDELLDTAEKAHFERTPIIIYEDWCSLSDEIKGDGYSLHCAEEDMSKFIS